MECLSECVIRMPRMYGRGRIKAHARAFGSDRALRPRTAERPNSNPASDPKKSSRPYGGMWQSIGRDNLSPYGRAPKLQPGLGSEEKLTAVRGHVAVHWSGSLRNLSPYG